MGCSEKKSVTDSQHEIPADSLIVPEKMVLILADVHVVEASLMLERAKGTDNKRKQDFYYRGIFAKYHISSRRYEQNIEFYRQNPDNFARMYEKVISVIENRQKKPAELN
jgi:hypothetical protein